MSTSTEYNLNVSSRYVAGWSAWEVVREIITNAMDADADWEMTRHGSDSITIYTSTVPRLGDMIVIGQGTKTADDDNIGQFGEGLKLAALACCRSLGKFKIVTPTGTVQFFLRSMPELDADVLHCCVDRDGESSPEGTYVHIKMIGCGEISERRFLRDRFEMRLEKLERTHLNVFLKGIWVKRVELHSLYDWNAIRTRINRDRSMVDIMHLENEICQWYEQHIRSTDCREMLENPQCFEVTCLGNNYWPPQRVKQLFADAFYEMHGRKTVLASHTEPRYNEYAMLKGYSVVSPGHDALERMLGGIVQTAKDIMPKSLTVTKLTHLHIKDCQHRYLNEARELLDRLGIPAEIRIFRDDPEVSDQHGHVTDGGAYNVKIWIKEPSLESREDFLSVLFSLLTTAKNRHPGCSLAFEGTLSSLCALIGTAWIEDHSNADSEPDE